jgi:hypothetical protein
MVVPDPRIRILLVYPSRIQGQKGTGSWIRIRNTELAIVFVRLQRAKASASSWQNIGIEFEVQIKYVRISQQCTVTFIHKEETSYRYLI